MSSDSEDHSMSKEEIEFLDREWRLRRTPRTDAFRCLDVLVTMFDDEQAGKAFLCSIFDSVDHPDGLRSCLILEDAVEEIETFGKDPSLRRLYALVLAAEAIRADQRGEMDLAWTYAADLQVQTEILTHEINGTVESFGLMARRGAEARHKENHAMRAQVERHYLENIAAFRSKDAAAEQIAGKIVPVAFRTVRNWLTNLPPAGRK